MYSFVGDKVLDPFAGIGSTAVACTRVARNSINFDIDAEYISIAKDRLKNGDLNQRYKSARLSDYE